MRIVSGVVLATVLALVGWILRRNAGEVHVAVYWPWLWVAAGLVLVSIVAQKAPKWTGRGAARVVGGGSLIVGVWFASDAVPAATPGVGIYPLLLAVGGLWLLVSALLKVNVSASRHWLTRWLQRRGKRGGFASTSQIMRVASRWAMRRKAKVLRPSLRQVPCWRCWFLTRTREYATAVARVGLVKVWSPIEDVTLRIGGPRSGKTGELAGRILDAPGAVISTSTRIDMVKLTAELRAKKGPVRVFNPSGLGYEGASAERVANTVTFNPLSGCGEPKTAVHRAEDLMSGASGPGKGGDMEFWMNTARRVLAALLHAAALAGKDMSTVLEWVAGVGDVQRKSTVQAEITRALAKSPEPAFELDAQQFLHTNDRTQSSICSTMMPALGWLTDATAVACTRGDAQLDVAELLASKGTVYMLGAEDGQTAPLVAALTGDIAREARRLAVQSPGERLDPPLTMGLDEIALVCPVPLDRWTADFGGFGVQLHLAAQGRSQMIQRWGREGAVTIMTNTGTLLVFGRSKDADDLEYYSKLSGFRWEDAPTDPGQQAVPQRVATMTPAQIAQLRPGRVLIIRSGMPPARGRVQMAWKRRDVRLHRWALRFAALLERVGGARNRAVQVAQPKASAAMQQWRGMRSSRGSASTPASITRQHTNRVRPESVVEKTSELPVITPGLEAELDALYRDTTARRGSSEGGER